MAPNKMGKRMRETIATILFILTLVVMLLGACLYIHDGYTPLLERVGIVAFITSVTGYLLVAGSET